MWPTLKLTEYFYMGEPVEAVRFIGDIRHYSIMLKWVRSLGAPYSMLTATGMNIVHPEGMQVRAHFGDYIIRNSERFYAVSSDMFEENARPAIRNRKKAS